MPPLTLILAAGASRRLHPLTLTRPKCLLEVGGRAILDHQLRAVREAGGEEVCLVVGYLQEQIREHVERRYPGLRFSFVVNPRFVETNTAYSMWLARPHFAGRETLFMNSDVVFTPSLLEQLASATHPDVLAVERKRCGEEEMKVALGDDGRVKQLSKALPPEVAVGEYVGVLRFGAQGSGAFASALDTVIGEGLENEYYDFAIERLAQARRVEIADVTGLPVMEIDTPEDYRMARHHLESRL
ncbi:MAG: phosphocholine cytidylyltransferase family protein [Archangiaceae bacterium]|nr:phosphocholine cytidylyltransferase family protein [Archangiaceae bacterium]